MKYSHSIPQGNENNDKWYTLDMALFMNQEGDRSELQKRLAAELADKAKKKSQLADLPPAKDLDDSHYLKDTKQTTGLAWLWILVIAAFLAAIVYLLIKG